MIEKNLKPIYEGLAALLEPYKEYLIDKPSGTKPNIQLWGSKSVVIEGRRRDSVFFAGIIEQKGYVGFYFMPVYSDAEARDFFDPALLKMLKGKSCFHITRWDENIAGVVEKALNKGFELYRSRGWI